MKKVLYFHPVKDHRFGVLGDDITFYGSVELLKSAIGEHEIITHYTEVLEELQEDKISSADILVLSGTPWLWLGCETCPKYKTFTRVVEFFGEKPKIALGIGSCYALNIIPETTHSVPKVWRLFDFIHARDQLTSGVFQNEGIKNTLSFCTSGFSSLFDKARDNVESSDIPTVIYHNPFRSISLSLITEEFCTSFNKYILNVIRKYNAKVITFTSKEKEDLSSEGIDSYVPNDVHDLIGQLLGSKFVLSARVHGAIPSAMLNIPTFIMPIDSRYLTSLSFGVVPIFEKAYNLEPNIYPFQPVCFSETLSRERNRLVDEIKNSIKHYYT